MRRPSIFSYGSCEYLTQGLARAISSLPSSALLGLALARGRMRKIR